MKCPVEIAHEMSAWQAAEKMGAKGHYERFTKTEHFICYEKRDISNVVRMGSFLMSVDISQILSVRSKLKCPVFIARDMSGCG
jgi:hypothetical protein